MDITALCDDGVSFQVNISKQMKGADLIKQIISIRKSSIPIIHLDLQDCILSINNGTILQILNSESLLYKLLTKVKVITAAGFITKRAKDLHRQNTHEFLVKRKSLELNYLKMLGGLNFPLESRALALQLATCIPIDENDNRTNISRSTTHCDSDNRDKRKAGAPDIGTLLKNKYFTFSNEVKSIIMANDSQFEGPRESLLALVEDLLESGNITELFKVVQEYENAHNYQSDIVGKEVSSLSTHVVDILDKQAINSDHISSTATNEKKYITQGKKRGSRGARKKNIPICNVPTEDSKSSISESNGSSNDEIVNLKGFSKDEENNGEKLVNGQDDLKVAISATAVESSSSDSDSSSSSSSSSKSGDSDSDTESNAENNNNGNVFETVHAVVEIRNSTITSDKVEKDEESSSSSSDTSSFDTSSSGDEEEMEVEEIEEKVKIISDAVIIDEISEGEKLILEGEKLIGSREGQDSNDDLGSSSDSSSSDAATSHGNDEMIVDDNGNDEIDANDGNESDCSSSSSSSEDEEEKEVKESIVAKPVEKRPMPLALSQLLNHKKKMLARSNKSSSLLLKRKFIGDEDVEYARASTSRDTGETPTIEASSPTIKDTALQYSPKNSLSISSSLPPTLKETYSSPPTSPLGPTSKDKVSSPISPISPAIKEKEALPLSSIEINEHNSSSSALLKVSLRQEEIQKVSLRQEEIQIEIKDTSDILKKFLDATGSSPGESDSDSDNNEDKAENGEKNGDHDFKMKEKIDVKAGVMDVISGELEDRNVCIEGTNSLPINQPNESPHELHSPNSNKDLMTTCGSVSPLTPAINKKHPVNKAETLKSKPEKSLNTSVNSVKMPANPVVTAVIASEPMISTPVTRRRNNEVYSSKKKTSTPLPVTNKYGRKKQ